MKNFNRKAIKIKRKTPLVLKISLIIVVLFFLLKLLGLVLIVIGGKMINDEFINPKPASPAGRFLIFNQKPSPTPFPTPYILPPIPTKKALSNNNYHIFQSFNNCGPAALSMALKFYGITESQEKIGQDLRPYQVPSGDNDDKSVTLEELANYSKKYGFIPYHRPMGNPEIVKQFLANDIPIIARTWLIPREDIGHYRVIKGYDESTGTYLQDDSLQNKNLSYSYSEFNELWKKFNYEYLVLVPKEKEEIAKKILKENVNEKEAWQSAVNNSLRELAVNPNDIDARFNLSVAYYNIGDYKNSIKEYEKVESILPFRTLWYQIEPIKSYYELGRYNDVLVITERILNNQNRAFSELYILRGKSYLKLGQPEQAREEFQKAIIYHSNNQEARRLFDSVN